MTASNRRMPVFLASSVVAMLVIVAVPGRNDETPGAPDADASALTALEASTDEIAEEELTERLNSQRTRSRTLIWTRNPFEDPTRPSEHMATGSRSADVDALPRLVGLCTMDGSVAAIIDNDIVRTGDQLPSGHRVLAIGDGSVTLGRDRKEWTLTLGDERWNGSETRASHR